MLSALLIHGVPIECINKAAVTYEVPAPVIISVLNTESGWPGLAKPNNNGSVDYGPMQINSLWLKKISPYGYTAQQLQNDPCINVMVGTWILGTEIAEGKAYWSGVGNYHSHTLSLNENYQQQVYARYAQLQQELSNAAS